MSHFVPRRFAAIFDGQSQVQVLPSVPMPRSPVLIELLQVPLRKVRFENGRFQPTDFEFHSLRQIPQQPPIIGEFFEYRPSFHPTFCGALEWTSLDAVGRPGRLISNSGVTLPPI